MLNLTTSTLRRALILQEKIESAQRELASLLGGNISPAGLAGEQAALPSPVRRGRRPGRPKGSGRKPGRPAKKAGKTGRPKTRGVSPLKGKKRPASPSGPLAPAVVKVMKRAGGPLNVDAVLQGLKQDKYVWNVKDPKKNLAARIYKLAGVVKVGPGMFGLVKVKGKK